MLVKSSDGLALGLDSDFMNEKIKLSVSQAVQV